MIPRVATQAVTVASRSNCSLYFHSFAQDVFGEEKTAQHKGTKMASTKYFRFNPSVGKPNSFPIDEVDPDRLQALCDIVDEYMAEDEQQEKLKQLGEVINPKSWVQRAIQCKVEYGSLIQ